MMQAVINENTTGNVLQLQAEIRRLRAILEKGKGKRWKWGKGREGGGEGRRGE